jgi:hypothetical protein
MYKNTKATLTIIITMIMTITTSKRSPPYYFLWKAPEKKQMSMWRQRRQNFEHVVPKTRFCLFCKDLMLQPTFFLDAKMLTF